LILLALAAAWRRTVGEVSAIADTSPTVLRHAAASANSIKPYRGRLRGAVSRVFLMTNSF